MSVSAVSSANPFDYNTQSVQSRMKQFQQEFQQLGQDLQSGNLSAAQSDFATLQQNSPRAQRAASSQSNNPIAQEFQQLGQDLQSGNTAAAQQDYSTIQQSLQSQGAHGHHHHHSHSGQGQEIGQEFAQLGQDLQSGNLSGAQQAYATLQQDLAQFMGNNSQGTTQGASNQSTSGSLSVNA